MKSELLEMRARHNKEEEKLRKYCAHPQNKIRKWTNNAGTVEIICRNCGLGKIIFNLDSKKMKTVEKKITRQGFKDERVGTVAQYDEELK